MPVNPANKVLLATKSLTKDYGRVRALDSLNLNIAPGEVYGLLGPNGAGKTTTILMMLGLTDVSDGTVMVAGHDPVRQRIPPAKSYSETPLGSGLADNK